MQIRVFQAKKKNSKEKLKDFLGLDLIDSLLALAGS